MSVGPGWNLVGFVNNPSEWCHSTTHLQNTSNIPQNPQKRQNKETKNKKKAHLQKQTQHLQQHSLLNYTVMERGKHVRNVFEKGSQTRRWSTLCRVWHSGFLKMQFPGGCPPPLKLQVGSHRAVLSTPSQTQQTKSNVCTIHVLVTISSIIWFSNLTLNQP